MKTFVVFLLILSLFHEGISHSEGISFSTCDEIINQQYNVNPITCSSNFVIISSTPSYTIDEPIHVKVRGTTPDRTFIGILLLAQDDKNTNVGSWKTSDSLVENVECGGVMHNSKIEKTVVEADWHASSNVVGNIIIKAIIIENNTAIYIDCYTVLIPQVLTSSSFHDEKDPPPTNATTTTTTNPPTNATTTTTTNPPTNATTTTTINPPTNATTTTTTTVSTTQSTTTTTGVLTTTSIPSSTTQTPSPTADVGVNASWTFNTVTNVTSFSIVIDNLKSAEWAALGLALNRSMGEAHVFMCKRLANDTIVVNRYINPHGHDDPESAGSEQGGAFTPGQQQFNNGVVTCQFSLSNFTTQTLEKFKDIQPLFQSTKYHPLIAIGMLDSDNEPQQHTKDSRTAKIDFVQLNETEIILYKINRTNDGEDSLKLLKAHGIIMVITWMFVVSTGILISRYFKTTWSNRLICGKAAWYAAHRFIMSIAAVLTMLGFLFVLVFAEGSWIDNGPTRAFAHSITGVLVISLSFLQPFVALFRCEPESQYRFIYNYIHAFIGFVAFVLSIAALFLATYFHLFKDNRARIIMILWTIYIVLIFATFEILKYSFRKANAGSNYSNINTSNTTIEEIVESPKSSASTQTRLDNQQETASQQNIKNILLATHILIAAILSIIFSTYIA